MTAVSPNSADDGPEALRLQIMGPLRIWRGGIEISAGPRQQRCLLALLLARGGHPVSVTELVALIWGADPPSSAVSVVHKYVGVLRRLLEPGLRSRTSGSFVLRDGNGYRATAGADTLDLLRFRRHVAAGRASAEEGHCEPALAHYSQALQLCRGPAGESLSDSAGAAAVFAGIDSEFFDAAVSAAAIAIRLRRPSGVLPALRLATEMDPFNEQVHASLMSTLAAAGRQAEALTVHRTIRNRLAEDLGIDPGQSLQQAHQQVLTQSALPPAPDAAHPRAGDGPLPLPLVQPAQLPPDLSLFVGRSAELDVLAGLMAGRRDGARTGPLVVAIDGMGGVGKSTLAARFARSVAGDFTDGQLYLDLRGEPGDALVSLLHALGVPASHVPGTFAAQVGTYRSLTADKRVLVLLDNVTDPARVRPLLPNSARSLVLITGRRPLLGLAAFEGAALIHLDVPDLRTARELLLRRLAAVPNRAAASDIPIVDEIIELCGRLPLALAILAARLTVRPGLSLQAVRDGLRGTRRLEAFPGGAGGHDPRTAFAWSYRQLSTGAARLFRLFAVVPGPGITAEAAVSLSGRDPDRTRAELDELTEAALVSEHEDGRFTSHVLVKAYAEELLRDTAAAGERREAVGRLLRHYLHSSVNAARPRPPVSVGAVPTGVVPERPAQAVAWFDEHREVLKEAVRVAADLGHGTVAWQLAVTVHPYLLQDAEEILLWALDAARAGGDEVGEAHVLRLLTGNSSWATAPTT